MASFIDMENVTLDNNCFRRVIFTGEHLQVVLMSLKKSEAIDKEIHEHVDQFFRVEEGHIEVEIYDDYGEEIISTYNVYSGQSIVISANTWHQVIAKEISKLYTIYTPPNHPPGKIECKKLIKNKFRKK